MQKLLKENQQLRMEREILKKRRSSLRKKSNKYGFIRKQQKTYPVAVLWRVMQVIPVLITPSLSSMKRQKKPRKMKSLKLKFVKFSMTLNRLMVLVVW
jgi:hypothetical protein